MFRWPVLLVFFCAFLMFAGTLGYDLVWDDERFIQYAEDRVTEGGVLALVTSEFRPDSGDGPDTAYFRPISLASLWLDNRLGAGSPVAFHLTNTLLHALCSVLVLVFLGMILGSRSGALGGALLFAVHPVHVESVAFVSGRTDLLASGFCLLSVILWLKMLKGQSSQPLRDLGLSLLAFAAACLSKEVAFVLPVVLLSWFFLMSYSPGAGAAARKNLMWGWFLASAAIVTGLGLLRYFVLHIGFGQGLMPLSTVAHSLGMLPGVLMKYLRLLIVPWPLRPYYWTQGVEVGLVDVLALLVLIGTFLLFFTRKNLKSGLAGIFWIFLFLLPVFSVVPIHGSPLAERYLYLPSVGFCLLIAGLWGRLFKDRRITAGLVIPGVALLLSFAVGTYSYSRVWRNDVTLYSEMVIKEPEAVIGYFNLGNAYLARGRLAGAEWAYKEAIAVEPRFGGSRINLLGLYLGMNRCADARQAYNEALESSQRESDELYGLVKVLADFGQSDAAAQAVIRLRRIDSDRADHAAQILSDLNGGSPSCSLLMRPTGRGEP